MGTVRRCAPVEGGVQLFRLAAVAAVLALVPLAAFAVPLAGQPAPDFRLLSPDKKIVTLGALKGHAVYVNFFASWCGPCNDEAPSIGALRAKYARSGLEIVGIDELDAPGEAAAFQKKYRGPYTVVAIDDSGTTGKAYGAIAMPVHIFINRRGVVTAYRIGQMDAGQIEAAIKDALK